MRAQRLVSVVALACLATVLLLLSTPVQSARRVPCTQGDCRPGKCEFVDCDMPVSCRGGLCVFRNCAEPRCEGGGCEFHSSSFPTCPGGRCSFYDTQTTLGAGYCKGGKCTVEGYEIQSNLDENMSF